MSLSLRPVLALSLWLVAGCVAGAPAPVSAVAAAPTAPVAAAADTQGLAFVEDDMEVATARARAEGKALFVDVWAPWCHTCLSMKNYVLTDPSLLPLASRVVFAAVDSDRPENARFMATHAVGVWPMYFVIDPVSDRVVSAWPGSASLAELRSFIDESLTLVDASRAGTLAADDPVRLIAEARAAHAAREPARAAELFELAAGKLPAGHPRRSEVLAGWLFALYTAKNWKGCAALGEAHLDELRGAAIPADFASFLLACADHVEPVAQARVRALAIARLRAFTASPPAEASADDRADAWNTLAEALADTGDEGGAKRAYEAKIAILVKAAEEAKTPEIAATFDYGRAGTYVALGRGGYAVALLERREREMPGSYEPPARLASVLDKLARYEEAKAAIERAIARAYGPRRLGYVRLRGDLQGKLHDRKGQIETLREEVRGYEALPPGQASPAALGDAKKRLAAAEAAMVSQ